jgi:predicted DNA-binding transcriptional regulator YafY
LNRTERLYKIQSLLTSKSVVPVGVFLKSLEVSRATFRRDLDYLRDRLGAPILWDRDAGGYRLQAAANQEPTASLPGLWLSDSEILALLTMIQLLSALEPNALINNQVTPIKKRIQNMLENGCVDADALTSRVRILPAARRPIDQDVFNKVADALLTRQRIEISHLNKGTNQETVRQVSPQQLIYYRDNWYMDAFCHDKDDLRSFSVDGIREVRLAGSPAVSLPAAALSGAFEETYGIFAGKRQKVARLRFTPFRARWVAKELWHPDQTAHFEADGHYVLEIPYGDERELILDILRQGSDCEVLAPASLRSEVVRRLTDTLNCYAPSAGSVTP